MPAARKALSTFDPMVAACGPTRLTSLASSRPGRASPRTTTPGHYARSFELTVIPALYPGTALNSQQALTLSPGITYAFPRPPGLNDGHPYFIPQCGITPAGSTRPTIPKEPASEGPLAKRRDRGDRDPRRRPCCCWIAVTAATARVCSSPTAAACRAAPTSRSMGSPSAGGEPRVGQAGPCRRDRPSRQERRSARDRCDRAGADRRLLRRARAEPHARQLQGSPTALGNDDP